MIGKHNDKSCIPTCFKYNNDLTHDPDQISNIFCNFFTNVGPNYANAIPAPKNQLKNNLRQVLVTITSNQISLPKAILINISLNEGIVPDEI